MNENEEVPGLADRLMDRLMEDARATGYAQGREDERLYGRSVVDGVRLALMSDELRMMPEILVDAYAALCVAALSDGTEGKGGRGEEIRVQPRVRAWRTSSNQTETRSGAKASTQKGNAGGPTVKSVRMLALKSLIDRKLRKLAREIESRMAGGTGESARKCSRCGKYGEDNWIWCPWDGAAMQSADRT